MTAMEISSIVNYGGAAAASAQEGARPGQFLTFMLGGEQFAAGILQIREIIEFGNPATVPMMPDCVRGVINLRGAVVPVMDLSARFGRGQATIGKRSCIVIVETGAGDTRQVMGMLVDAVNAVVEIAAADIEPAPSFGTSIRSDFIGGMGKHGGRFVMLLDIERVLSGEEIVELARRSAAPA
jgi:purine-binding chemotaxis protein CheW